MGGPDDPLTRIEGYARAYRRPLTLPRRLGFISGVTLGVLGLSFLARIGEPWARVSAGVGMLLCLVTSLWLARFLRRGFKEPRRALFLSLRRWNEEHAKRAVRALTTYERLEKSEEEATSGESPELARLHLSRVLDGVDTSEVARTGQNTRRRIMSFVAPMVLGCIALLWVKPLSILEGVDVLLAQKGVGPYPIAYVADLRVTAELPSYLDGTGTKRPVSPELTAVPRGSEIEVKVLPRILGRKLVLTDGMEEVPLVSDGRGGLVGRWKADNPAMLRVATRFGEVLLFDPQTTLLSPLEDQAPRVHLKGAPARLELESIEDLELDYTALDDHGITQVDLVIESGQRSEREELTRLDGQKRAYRGAHRLPASHEMLRRAFLPVRIRVEARDGNTATGPSWGKSESFVLLPQPLGKEIAERHKSLRAFRGALTKYLADDLRAARLSVVEAQETRQAAQDELRAAHQKLEEELKSGADVPAHTLAFLAAQIEALTRKGAERSSSEAVVLAADALIGDIAVREAQRLSKDLGSAVEEIAVQSREIRHNPEEIKLSGLMDLVAGANQGASQLREVGVLGLDLGSVAKADLSRIETSLQKKEYDRAEAAAIHLAERLKRATPSFGSKGGAVESGMPQSGGDGASEGQSGGSASDAPEQFQELSQEVDQLAQESAEELAELERMLREARQAAEADFDASDELEEAADELRQALSRLPNNASSPGGPRAEAASARGHGEAMAEALDAGDLFEAIERGVDAEDALTRAKKLLEERRGWVDEESLEAAADALERALKEAKKAAERLEQKQRDEMGNSLSDKAKRQREFSERAKDLAKKGRDPQAPLPSESIEALEKAARLMEEAAREIDAGRAEKGAEAAAEAQTELERALPRPPESEGSPSDGGEGEGEMSREGSVPDEEKDRARDFRERVERGLGRGAGRLSPAVRRYAEELK